MDATSLINATKTGTSPTTTDPTGSNTLGKDAFIKLLVAQLGNQDPTAPTDNTAFVAQLAQFSSLEQMQNVNTTLTSIAAGQSTGTATAAANLVGDEALFSTDKVVLGGDGVASSSVGTLAANAATVTLKVTDAQGASVRTLQLGTHTAGPVTLQWDGKKDDGTRAPAGTYQVSIAAADIKGQAVATTLQTRGVITGVSFADPTSPTLIINNDINAKLSDVQQINQRSTP